jgi:hypothetical protein
MLTYDELVNQANKLPLSERLSLLETIAKSVKDEVTNSPSKLSKEEKDLKEKNKPDQKDLLPLEQIEGMLKPKGPMYSDEDVEEILPLKKLRGILKPDGPIPSDSDLEDARYQYLAEKYGL